jgi:hypothetical protein
MELELETLIASRGPAIKGRTHIEDVLNKHLQFFDKVILDEGQLPKSWAKPAPTSLFFTPREPWSLLEHEETSS